MMVARRVRLINHHPRFLSPPPFPISLSLYFATTNSMRAVVLERYGTAKEALVLHTDWPLPERQPHQVLIEAAATSVNAGMASS